MFVFAKSKWWVSCALVGFVGISFQLCAFRILQFYLEESLYSASLSLGIYFLGMLIGFHAKEWLTKREFQLEQIAFIVSLFIACFFITVLFHHDSVFLFLHRFFPTSFLSRLALSAIVLILPAALLGVLLPIAYAVSQKAVPPPSLSVFLSVDTGAGLTAIALVGMLFLPLLGTETTILFLCFASTGLVFWLSKSTWEALGTIAILGVISFCSWRSHDFNQVLSKSSQVVLSESDIRGSSLMTNGELKVLDSQASAYGWVSILQSSSGDASLILNRRPLCVVAGAENKEKSFLSEALIAKDTLSELKSRGLKQLQIANVGLGCGVTLSQLVRDPSVNQVEVIEINPVIARFASYFEEPLHYSLADPKISLVVKDANEYFPAEQKKFHSIVIDVEEPSIMYSSRIYTVEFLKAAKSNLSDEGVLSLWAYFGTGEAGFATIARTLQSQFKHVLMKNYISPHYSAVLSDGVAFFASDSPLHLEALDIKDSDLTAISHLSTFSGEVNTQRNHLLSQQWHRQQWSVIWK